MSEPYPEPQAPSPVAPPPLLSPDPLPQVTETTEPPLPKRKRKDRYYPAPKNRKKPWLRPRGPGGWQKVHTTCAPDSSQTLQTSPSQESCCLEYQACGVTTPDASSDPECLNKTTQADTRAQQAPTHHPRPIVLRGTPCAYCLGVPSGASRCSCVSLALPIPSPLCAFCLGAPTGRACTCAHTLDTLFDYVLLDLYSS